MMVKVFTRSGPDDSIYDNNLDIRQKVARGNCLLEILGGENPGLMFLVSNFEILFNEILCTSVCCYIMPIDLIHNFILYEE